MYEKIYYKNKVVESILHKDKHLLLSSMIKEMFIGNQGFWYDPNDLTSEKINWQRNLLTETEFRNGINDSTVKVGKLTSVPFDGLTTGTGIQLEYSANDTYIYKSATYKAGTSYTFSCYVRMLDGSTPRFGITGLTDVDICLVMKGAAYQATVQDLGGGLYRAHATISGGISSSYFGVVKYATNSTKPVIVSGYQLEESSQPSAYQAFTDFNNEFIKQFPLHTLYQDAAGTIPVTAAGQPVGLMLDKSKGLALSSNINSVTNIESVPIGGAAFNSYPIGGNSVAGRAYLFEFAVTDYSGTGNVTVNGGGSQWVINPSTLPSALSGNATYKVILFALVSAPLALFTRNTNQCKFSNISVKELAGNHAYQTVSTSRPVFQQTPILGNEITNVTSVTGLPFDGATYRTYAIGGSIVAGKRYRLRFRMSNYSGTGVIGFSLSDFAGASFSANGLYELKATALQSRSLVVFTGMNATANFSEISVKEVTGYRTDQNYLAFDGVDDYLQTSNIDFTATDKVSLFAGVRKLRDAATNVIVELSAAYSGGTPGCFTLQAATASANTFAFGSRGNVTPTDVVTPANYPPPISAVLSASASISNDTLDLRVNGSYVIQNRQDQGTGTYLNYPLYIGRRGGTSLPFNGHLYSLIGIGRITTDSETIALEKSIAKKVGVLL